MQVVGIDISKKKFDVCLLCDGQKFCKDFANYETGFYRLLNWLKKQRPLQTLETLHFCMEATGCYGVALAEFLHKSHLKISVTNPLQVKRFRESKMIRQKTDKSDAFAIAEFCMQNNPRLWAPTSLECKQLRDVTHHIEDLKEELQRWKNRLENNQLYSEILADVCAMVKKLEEQIKHFEQKAQEIVQKSEYLSQSYDKMVAIKGVGPVLALTILSDIPEVKNFANAKQFAAYMGVTPSHFQSGTSVNGRSHISKKGSQRIRKVLYMAGIVAKNHNEHFKGWVEKLEKKGKAPKVIICAVMRKLAHIIFGALKAVTGEFDISKTFAA